MTELEPIRRRLVAGVVIVDDLPLGAGRQLLLGRGEAGNCLVSVGEPNGIAVSPFQLGWQQGEGGALTDAFPDSLYPLGALVPDWAGQPARLETATLLDPDRIALDALRGADLPTRLSWVLELVTLIREQAKLAAAFDPAALAFSPSPPHLRSIDPQAPAGSESEIVRGLATTATLLLTSSLPREDRVPVGRISPVLVDLLERALDSRAGVRPSLATLGAGLQRALAERDYAWRPREHPSASLIAVACTLAALWALGQVSAPASPREAAQGAFVAAAAESEQNPAGARLALERLAQGSPLLPEARRALALGELRAWRERTGPSPEVTLRMVKLLEAEGIAGRDDPLAASLQLVCGVLRRWELAPRGDLESGARGDALLLDLIRRPSIGDDLRAAAKAALRAHPQGGGPAMSQAELTILESCGDETGLLARRYSPIRYAADPQPPARPLKMGWIADLLAGQHHAIAGRQAEASRLLRRSEKAFSCYATRVSLGLTLLRGSAKERSDGEALLGEPARAPGGERLRLALAELSLKAGRLAAAIPELRAVASQAGASPVAVGRAKLLLRQAEILSVGRRAEDDPAVALERLQSLLGENPSEDPYEGDLLLIAAAAQAGLGRAELGAARIWAWLGKRTLEEALSKLPSLPLAMPTRSPETIRALLLSDLSARSVEGVRGGKGDVAQIKQQLSSLGAARPTESGGYALILAATAGLRYVAGKVEVQPTLEVLTAAASASASPVRLAQIEVEVRLRASRDPDPQVALGHLNAAERAIASAGLSDSEAKAAGGRWRNQVLSTLARLRTSRAKAWATLTPESPQASVQALSDLPALSAVLEKLVNLPARQETRLRVAELRGVAGLLSLVAAGPEGRRDPAAFRAGLQHLAAGIQLLEVFPPDPEVTEVRKGLHLAAGLAILGADPKALLAAQAQLPPDQVSPQAAARLHFCQAGGLLDPAMWREEIDAGFKPLGPKGREQSALYWVARSWLEEALAAPKKDQGPLKVEAARAYADFEKALKGAKGLPPGSESWRAEAAKARR